MKQKRCFSTPTLVVMVTATLALTLCSCQKGVPKNELITGMIEASETDVSSKIPGRIDSIWVKEGDLVKKGDTLAILQSREVRAKVEQARAAVDIASAKSRMARNGLRPQEVAAMEKLYLQAKAGAELTEKTWNRVKKLADDKVISVQERDQVETQFIAAQEQMHAAQLKYQLAVEGTRTEDKDAAASLVRQAENLFNEASAYLDEMILVAPRSGEVSTVISDNGEIVSSGYPILSIVDLTESKVILQVKETKLARFPLKSSINGTVPALDNKTIAFKVSTVSAMGEFASWRPTNQRGEFDVRTFEVHLRPVDATDLLRPGMSVNFSIPQ